MLNTLKLLYVLPDLAYLAELLPGKKEHSFQIHSFKQFNGELIKDGKFIQENIQSLMKKIEEDEYQIVLPDELFTNTIINAEKENEKEVKDYLKEEVIPSLHISSESHQIETFILSEFRGVYKVQLSTIQKSLLSPLKAAAQDNKIFVKNIYPLSWVIKSLISLEPSLSILQMGESLYMAKHYIGVDEPLTDSVENMDRFVEAIKTLKGVEPSLQTVYLLTSEIVEDSLKEKLDKILPLQQLAQSTKEDAKVPGYLEKIVTSSMRTISIPDFEIPQFGLKDVDASKSILNESSTMKDQTDDLKITKETLDKVEGVEAKKLNEKDDVVDLADLPKPQTLDSDLDLQAETSENQEEIISESNDQNSHDSSDLRFEDSDYDDSSSKSSAVEEDTRNDEENDQTDGVDLSKFASVSDNSSVKTNSKDPYSIPEIEKVVIKNNDGTSSFLKVFLIGLGSFILTVAVGVGIGVGLLKISQSSTQPAEEPLVEWSEPAVEIEEGADQPEEVESEVVELDRSEYSIRVVNATTKAGYAGEIANKLKAQEYKSVDAKNAVESYEEGNFVVMNEENADLINALSEDAGLELVYLEGTEAEDPSQEYDAVVVLAE